MSSQNYRLVLLLGLNFLTSSNMPLLQNLDQIITALVLYGEPWLRRVPI